MHYQPSPVKCKATILVYIIYYNTMCVCLLLPGLDTTDARTNTAVVSHHMRERSLKRGEFFFSFIVRRFSFVFGVTPVEPQKPFLY